MWHTMANAHVRECVSAVCVCVYMCVMPDFLRNRRAHPWRRPMHTRTDGVYAPLLRHRLWLWHRLRYRLVIGL